MNICGIFLNSEIRTGGHRRYLSLLTGLQRHGHSITMIKRSGVDLLYAETIRKKIALEVHEKPSRSVGFIRSVIKNKSKIESELKNCEYVIVFGETHLFCGLYLSQLLKAKFVFSLRSNAIQENISYLKYDKESTRKRLKFLIEILKYWVYEALIIHRNMDLVLQSNYDFRDIKKRHFLKRATFHVIGGNYDLERFPVDQESVNKSKELKNLLFIGSINKRKGIFLLLEAFKQLFEEKEYELTLHIAGFGPMENEFLVQLDRFPFKQNVNFLGRVDDPFRVLTDTDLLIVPSLFDSYPNVILEALYVGTPVIASETGGIPEMVEYPEMLFEPGSVTAIKDKVQWLISSRENYSKIKEMTKILHDKFNFDWPARFIEIL